MTKNQIIERMNPYDCEFDRAVAKYKMAIMWSKNAKEKQEAQEILYNKISNLFEKVVDLFSGCLTDALDVMKFMGWQPILELLEI